MLNLNINLQEEGLQVDKTYNATLTFTNKKVKECTCGKETCNKDVPRFKVFDEIGEEGKLPSRFSMKKIGDDSVIKQYISKESFDNLQNEIIELSRKLADTLPLLDHYRMITLHSLEIDPKFNNGRNI